MILNFFKKYKLQILILFFAFHYHDCQSQKIEYLDKNLLVCDSSSAVFYRYAISVNDHSLLSSYNLKIQEKWKLKLKGKGNEIRKGTIVKLNGIYSLLDKKGKLKTLYNYVDGW